ncbi:MAG: protein kinase [Acidobacteria bacterium]|nr:protein kinase [Acidobacteriota bacterium]
MTDARWQQIERIYHDVVSCEEPRRTALLDELCAADVELRRDVESLLAREPQAAHFLDTPPWRGIASALDGSCVPTAGRGGHEAEAEPERQLLPGTRFGPYEIQARVGAGGMGEVYRARDVRLGRAVALKLLVPALQADNRALERFRREALAASALNHPNICTIYDIGDAGGRQYIAMEYIAGRTLRDLIGTAGLPLNQALDYAVQIADALATAHATGIVHRDLKPDNILVTNDGRVKVVDFGLAKLVEGAVGSATDMAMDTRTSGVSGSVLIGTAAYMSPEQVHGRPVDHRSDLFSFGIVLCEMTAGARPFTGHSAFEVLAAIINDVPAPITTINPALPAGLESIIGRSLAKDPDERYQSAGHLADDLRRLQHHDRPSADAATPLAGPRRHHARAIRSLAVLPFDNLAQDPAQDYFVDGLHDALITELVKLDSVGIRSRGSVLRYRGRTKSLKEVARELKVDALVEGSILRSGDRVRVTAQLIRGATDEHLWAQSFDRGLTDVLVLLDEVSKAIAVEIDRTVGSTSAPGRSLRREPHRVRPEAYDAYLRAMQSQSRQAYDVRKYYPEIERAFEDAITLDPEFPQAWGALALAMAWGEWAMASRAWSGWQGSRPPGESLRLSREAARRALALDERIGRAWSALGVISLYFDWDFTAAQRELSEAVRLEPHDAPIRHAYSDYFMVMGQTAESLAHIHLGLAHNPDSLLARVYVPGHAVAARRYEEAIDGARELLASNPGVGNARYFLAKALWLTDRHEDAIVEFGTLWGPASSEARALDTTFRSAGPRAAMKAVGDCLAGRTDGPPVDPTDIAVYYAMAEERDAAVTWLEKAFARRTPRLLHVPADPFFDSIRGDPRIDDLCRRVGLPIEAWRGPWASGAASPAG